ncbi:maltokinase [Streptomyces sp. NPDC032198]|uniref:maltokinase N-terminal cap-like domain-containing protein n=1 Tax=Streptomyces sp. NPDC032198 TaxID=3155127 RepID=UPI00340D7F6E
MSSPLLLSHDTQPHPIAGPTLAALLSRWLPRQRWFAHRERAVTGVSVTAATELAPDIFHLLVRVEQSGLPQDSACYQLLLGAAPDLPPRLGERLLGRMEGSRGHDLLVYDALYDPRATILLLDRIRRGGVMGALRFESYPRSAVPAGLMPHVLDVEQSNTSIVYGDEVILKLFRRVQPGINPDLEIPGVLARHGYTRVPAPVAWFHTTQPFWGTLGVVQRYLPRATDGWTLALQSALSQGDFTDHARELGALTGELHVALAESFPVGEPASDHHTRLADQMTHRLLHAAATVPALRSHVPGLREVFIRLATADGGLHLQRIHGDLHLGQVLRADGQWHVVDFEGEPAKPLAERRADRSPIHDIAGMLRSFDYAAHVEKAARPEWATRCRTAFCDGYGATGLFDPQDIPVLLHAHEADRAVYEVLYESTHRPDWITAPLRAVARLARHE